MLSCSENLVNNENMVCFFGWRAWKFSQIWVSILFASFSYFIHSHSVSKYNKLFNPWLSGRFKNAVTNFRRCLSVFSYRIPMAALSSFMVILAFLTINDLVETDKIGSFFFIFIAILVNTDIYLLDKK